MITTLLLASVLSASASVENCFAFEFKQDCDHWTKENTELELALSVLSYVDVMQTRYFTTHTTIGESNPLMGVNPSASRLYLMTAVELLVHTGVMRIIPNPYRASLQGASIFAESIGVGRNAIMFNMHMQF